MRISKAWSVHPIERNSWDDIATIYAENATKAKGKAYRDLCDIFDDLSPHHLVARREKSKDILFPDEHRLVHELSEKHRRIISNAYGYRHNGYDNYRKHYCTEPGDIDLLYLTFELGIFEGPYGEIEYGGHIAPWVGVFFFLTELGQNVARSMIPTYPR